MGLFPPSPHYMRLFPVAFLKNKTLDNIIWTRPCFQGAGAVAKFVPYRTTSDGSGSQLQPETEERWEGRVSLWLVVPLHTRASSVGSKVS